MRVMVLVKANAESEAGALPTTEVISAMNGFNEQLVKAGVMLAAEGLHPTSKAVRVAFSNGSARVIDGPFAETKELLAGYWLWQVSSLDEAVEWIRRSPFADSQETIEIRPVFETDHFGDQMTPEQRQHEQRLRDQAGAR